MKSLSTFTWFNKALNLTLLRVRVVILCVGVQLLSLDLKAQIPGEFYYDGDQTVELKGEWKFRPDAFLTYSEVLTDTLYTLVSVPGDWNVYLNDSTKFGPKGYGTYYAKIAFAPNIDLSNLAIRIPEVALAYNIYINGDLIGSLGRPGKSMDEELPMVDGRIIEIPPLQASEIYVILHISNFSYSFGGLYYPPKFGNEEQIRIVKERKNTIKLLILGTVIILAIYMLYVYNRLGSEMFRVYFAMICLLILFHTLTTGDMPLLDIFPSLNWVVNRKIAFVSFFLIAPFNGKFLLELFPRYLNSRVINIYLIIALIAVVFTIIGPVAISAYLIIPFQVLTVVAGLYFFESLIRATYGRENGARILLIGYAFAFITGVNDILSMQYIISTDQMAHYGLFGYILVLTMVMAMRYVDALKRNQDIAESLSLSNELLEKNIEDRTKRLQAQNLLIDAKNQELENALQEKEDLMAVVAHDLKAPFSQIEELTKLLEDEVKLKKNQANYMDMIKKITQNARRIIENLVFIRSYQSEAFNPEMRYIILAEFFNGKVATFQTEANKKSISIESGHSIQSKEIYTDESALDRIVDNLVSNALKFSPMKSKIVFEMLEEDKNLVLRVKDYGDGFSEDDKKNAFKKFQKLSAKPTGGELSTGLGLSIIKTLVEKLKGEISLVSEKGKGAEFIVKIPIEKKKPVTKVSKKE